MERARIGVVDFREGLEPAHAAAGPLPPAPSPRSAGEGVNGRGGGCGSFNLNAKVRGTRRGIPRTCALTDPFRAS